MYLSLKKKFVWCLLAILPATSSLAAAPSAMLYASGKVSVNGTSIVRSTSVFDGDRIVTLERSAGTVSLNGSSVLVHSDSSVIFNKASVRVNFGGAAIKTSQGLGATSGDVSIAPVAQASRYNVTQYKKTVTISALEGKLSISQGTNNFALEQGKTISIVCRTCDDTEPPLGLVVPKTTAFPTGAKIATGTAVGAGVIAAILLNQSPASPTVP